MGFLASRAVSPRVVIKTGLFALVLLSQAASAAIWNDVAQTTAKSSAVATTGEQTFRQRRLNADPKLIAEQLQSASAALSRSSTGSPASIELPMPDGSMRRYSVVDSPIIANGQAANYPQIKTYKIHALDGSSMTGRVSVTPLGFNGYIDTPQGTVLIDPIPGSHAQQYRSFYKLDYAIAYNGKLPPFSCGVQNRSTVNGMLSTSTAATGAKTAAKTEGAMRDYRIAIAATGEYSQAVASYYVEPLTVANVRAEIINAVNRVNQIYERDLGIHLNYVVDDNIIFLDANTDPYTNNDATLLLDQNQAELDLDPGSANYDIGHVFSTGGGGLASLGVVCDDTLKAQGETGSPQPVGDPFYIDYVAHEIGHQFGADHSFNGTTDNCGYGNRNAATAWEPGSGSTVMGYAGICGNEDIASNSDAVFHAGSVDEITAYTTTSTGALCASTGANAGNHAPVVNAGVDYTIPGGTDFELKGSATDVDTGDTANLLYHWDEMDAGTATNSSTIGTDLGSNALFRSYEPTSSPDRTFPNLSDVLNNTVNTKGETLPTRTRTLHFRLTAVDGKGGSDNDNMQITVDGNSGPFKVLQPNTAITLDSSQPQVIEWSTACTDAAPVNCANVDILYSSDGGATFNPLLMATPNDGEATVSLPAGNTSQARIEIRCSDNIFYDVSDTNFTVSDVSGESLVATGSGASYGCGTQSSNDVEPNGTVAFASAITIPVTFNGAVNSTYDTDDYYVFTPATTGTYSFTLSAYGNNDLNLYLLNSTPSYIDKSESISATTESFSDSLSAGKTYYVRVSAQNTSGLTVSYSLSINVSNTTSTSTNSNNGGGSMGIVGLIFVILIKVLRRVKNHTFNNLVISSLWHYLSVMRWQAAHNNDKINTARLYSKRAHTKNLQNAERVREWR